MIKAEEIINKQFSRAFWGYDIGEVDEFLDDIVRSNERAEQELEIAQLRIKMLLEELQHYTGKQEDAKTEPETAENAETENMEAAIAETAAEKTGETAAEETADVLEQQEKSENAEKEKTDMEEITIRYVKPEDAERVTMVEGTCFPPAEAASRERIEARIQAFPKNFWVAEADGCVVGFINGTLVARLELPPFIATLGTQMMSMGLGSIITKVQSQTWPTATAEVGAWFKKVFIRADIFGVKGFPVGAFWLFGFFIIAALILHKTKFGRYTYAIGSNEEAARLSGINVDSWKVAVYTLSGFFIGMAGIFYAAAYTTITPGTGNGLEMNGITGVIIGGTSMSGGSGTMVGTLIGVFIMSVLKNGLSSCGLQAPWQTFLTGVVVIGAVLLDIARTKAANRVKKG